MNFDDYKVKAQYPDRPRKQPILTSAHSTAEDARKHWMAMQEWEKNMEAFKVAIKAYHKEEGELMARFREDVLRENGLNGHPKADKVYARAWEEGHANGLYEVSIWVSKLAEIVKD